MSEPTEESINRVRNYVAKYCERTGLVTHSMPEVTDAVVNGLANHIDTLGKPLCPCRFYPDKQEEIKSRTWLCPCEDMKKYKYCHCMLFVTEDGMPVTEHLPEDHEGRATYGEVKDPAPEKYKAPK
ncbi:MAG: ferredoxin:thioredoxin reductase [Desulfovibrionales bacterium]|nr:ferredoxin:thioredoxin reductase [Desulfovibrionales bacterium]